MYIKPLALGFAKLDDDTLRADRTACRHFGPCGVGDKALYLNSFYLDCRYYVPVASIRRVYKRIAMSKGGFSGKGMFATIPYLVVEYDDGGEKQCNFKAEQDVDLLLACVKQRFPQIRTLSAAAEKRMAAAEAERMARPHPALTPEAAHTLELLHSAEEYLQRSPELSVQLSAASRAKRSADLTHPSYKWVALAIVLGGAGTAVYGIRSLATHSGSFGLYFLLLGLAAIFLFSGASVMPTASTNRKALCAQLDAARNAMNEYLLPWPQFPLPAKYAHPAALSRMCRAVEEGRAETPEQALDALKEELKSINSAVQVSQEDYDEIVAIKPMFLLEDYA